MLPILLKTEEAVLAIATSASNAAGFVTGSTVFVYHGHDNADLAAPAIICHAEDATEDFPFSGIYHCMTNLTVKEMAADTSSGSFGALSDPIFHAFLDPNIEGILSNSVSNYFVYKLIVEDTNNDISQDAWSQTYRFDIVCGLTP